MRFGKLLESFILLEMLCTKLYVCEMVLDLIRYDGLANLYCSPYVFDTPATSVLMCGVLCLLNSQCKSVFYIPDEKCIGCDKIYSTDDANTLTEVSSAVYYRPYAFYGENCSDTKPCVEDGTVCYPGLEICVCHQNLMYDPNTGTCVQNCTYLGATYQFYPLSVVLGFDDTVTVAQNNVTVCLERCTLEAGCYGVDYDFVGKICYNNNHYVVNTFNAWQYSAIFDTYVRNCL